jgi:hypothetical protein
MHCNHPSQRVIRLMDRAHEAAETHRDVFAGSHPTQAAGQLPCSEFNDARGVLVER